MKLKSILVTGCGGDIALGVGRVLRELKISGELVGCDAGDDHPGVTVFDSCALVPRADSPAYVKKLSRLAEESEAGLIVPMTEPELAALHEAGALESLGGIPVLAANPLAVKTGLDKLATARFLESKHIASPWTALVSDGQPRELPCLLKPRAGSGGRSVIVVKDESTAQALQSARRFDIWQEYLDNADEEYTVGLFRSAAGDTRSIALHRVPGIGGTERARVVRRPDIEKYVASIAAALDLRGAVNVQLRLTKRGPVAFEINPRFSSTAPMRHRLGFHDVLWAVEDRLGRRVSPYKPPKPGTRVYRTYGEAVLP